jgi:hypothetical protein
MIGNFISQKISSSGTGNLVLGDAISSYATVDQVFSNGDQLFYVIIDGNNRETGLGTYDSGAGEIVRDVAAPNAIFETYSSGSYDSAPVAGISLSGNAILAVAPSIQALTTHLPVWKRKYANLLIGTSSYANEAAMATLTGNLKAPEFAGTVTDNTMGFSIELGHDIGETVSVTPSIIWSPSTSNTGDAKWELETTILQPGSTVGGTNVQTVTQAAGGVAGAINEASFATLTIPEPNCVIVGVLKRLATDVANTHDYPVHLISIAVSYQATQIGTPAQNSDYFDWS